MELGEYQEQLTRLSQHFGARVYSKEMTKLLWPSLQPYSVTHLRKAVDEAIGNLRSAPLKDELVGLCARYHALAQGTKKTAHGPVGTEMHYDKECKNCGTHGFVFFENFNGFYQCVVACWLCELGRHLEKSGNCVSKKRAREMGYVRQAGAAERLVQPSGQKISAFGGGG